MKFIALIAAFVLSTPVLTAPVEAYASSLQVRKPVSHDQTSRFFLPILEYFWARLTCILDLSFLQGQGRAQVRGQGRCGESSGTEGWPDWRQEKEWLPPQRVQPRKPSELQQDDPSSI